MRVPPATLAVPLAVPLALLGVRGERGFTGIPNFSGVAIGPVFSSSEPKVKVTRHKIQAADTAAEGARFDAALAQSRKQLGKLRARLAILPEESQQEIAPLIDAYIRMIGPSRLVRGIRRRIDETLLSAESAVVEEAEAIAGAIQAQAEPRRHPAAAVRPVPSGACATSRGGSRCIGSSGGTGTASCRARRQARPSAGQK